MMIEATLQTTPDVEARRSATRQIKHTRAKLAVQSVDPITFQYELLLLFARNQMSVGLALPVFALALCATAIIWSEWAVLLFWLAGVFVAQGLMLGLCERFEREPMENVNVVEWGRRLAAMEFVSGLAWAALIIIGWAADNTTSQVFLFAITIIMIAIRVSLAPQALAIVYAGTLPLTFATTLRMLIEGGALHLALAGIVVAAELYFVWLARRLNQTALQMIAYRAEKDALIAELEEAQARSEDARLRAEDANIAKSRFLATMSHELRTPLNAILGFSEVMKSELMGPHAVPTYREYAADIHKSGGHLLNLINEILDLSRIEAGRYELNEALVNVAQIGRECHKLMTIRAGERAIQIGESFELALPMIWADERAIRQVWLNLVSNAIKFTPTGGRVTLKAWRTPTGGIALSVKDTGPGIPAEEIPRILSAFGQGALARRHAGEGAGLGLPIVKGLAELHGGSFKVISKLRHGAEMIVNLPFERVRVPGDGLNEAQEPPELKLANVD